MLTKETREFVLTGINTLYSIPLYTPYAVDNNLQDLVKWCTSIYSGNPITIGLKADVAIQQAIEVEKDYHKELKDLAVETVSTAFGKDIKELLEDENVKLELSLNENPLTFKSSVSDKKDEQLDLVKYKDWITRRRLLHGITACTGLKMGVDLHKLVKDELNNIDNRLPDLYDTIGIYTLVSTYTMPPYLVMSTYDSGDKGNTEMDNATSVESDEDEMKIKVTATSFNMMLHELSKAILNYFLITTIPVELRNDNKKLLTQFYEESDKLIEEYFHFICSMKLYLNLTNWIVENELSFLDVFERLTLAPPKDVIEFLEMFYEEDLDDVDYIWERKLNTNYYD